MLRASDSRLTLLLFPAINCIQLVLFSNCDRNNSLSDSWIFITVDSVLLLLLFFFGGGGDILQQCS